MSEQPMRVPGIGETVIFYLNHDLVPSPATVINTLTTTDHGVLDEHEPVMPQGSYVGTELSRYQLREVDPGERYRPPDDELHLDLLVHGLLKDYRAYNVPYSEYVSVGHWTLPSLDEEELLTIEVELGESDVVQGQAATDTEERA